MFSFVLYPFTGLYQLRQGQKQGKQNEITHYNMNGLCGLIEMLLQITGKDTKK